MPPLLALFSWPLVVLAFARKFPAALAFTLAILTGFLLLPETISFDLPVLPALTKHSIPALSVLLFIALFHYDKGRIGSLPLIPEHPFVRVAATGLILGALLTVATNGDPLHYGPTALPGMRLYDGLSLGLTSLITILPMLLARKFLASPETHVLLLKALCIAAIFYTIPALLEVRLSPQMNQWVYGFFPHSWAQHYRGGGWRPIVFMRHGLVLSLFFCMVTIAAAGLMRIDGKKRNSFLAATVWLFATLVLSKSLGALSITIMLLPAALFLGTRGQLIMASAIAFLVLIYPLARSTGVIPVHQVTQMAEKIDPQRAASFNLRVINEDQILAKAQQRPLFGWGAWGRSRVYDPSTGVDVTVADGQWAGVLGIGGWCRYLFEFGLLCIPILLLLRHRQRYQIGMESSVLALMLAANLIDLIPNSGVTPITWMIAGTLWGRLELGRIKAEAGTETTKGDNRPRIAYRRALSDPEEAISSDPRRKSYTRQKSRHVRE